MASPVKFAKVGWQLRKLGTHGGNCNRITKVTLLRETNSDSNGDDVLCVPLETRFFTDYVIATLNDKSFPETLKMLTNQARTGAILCEPCNGRGWLVCDFCKGQKTNVKSDSNRTYRRCPSCRAVGYVLCSKCKVFKCVTLPNCNDGEELSF